MRLHIGRGNHQHNRILGNALHETRVIAKISGTELARVTGLSRQMISGIEKGREAPSLVSLTQILTGLGEEYQITDDDSVSWSVFTIVCTRYSRYRTLGQHLPAREVVSVQAPPTGYLQILDWR